MTSITAVQAAAHERLAGLSGRPDTAWPNVNNSGATPRYEVYDGSVASRAVSLRGSTSSSLLLQVDVVVEAGLGPVEMRDLVQPVVDLFPLNQDLGGARVSGPASIGGYRQDGTEYRCSVTIPYRLLKGSPS